MIDTLVYCIKKPHVLHYLRSPRLAAYKMSVYDKNSPMNDILIRGEEARRRRSKKRRLQPGELIVDSNVRLRREPEPQVGEIEVRT